jgi:hypothetical protein
VRVREGHKITRNQRGQRCCAAGFDVGVRAMSQGLHMVSRNWMRQRDCNLHSECRPADTLILVQ